MHDFPGRIFAAQSPVKSLLDSNPYFEKSLEPSFFIVTKFGICVEIEIIDPAAAASFEDATVFAKPSAVVTPSSDPVIAKES